MKNAKMPKTGLSLTVTGIILLIGVALSIVRIRHAQLARRKRHQRMASRLEEVVVSSNTSG